MNRAFYALGVAAVVLLGVQAYKTHQAEKRHTIHITEQDLVRYCLDRRREQADAKEIEYYCRDLGGDYYIAQGVKPNYNEFPTDKMFLPPAKK